VGNERETGDTQPRGIFGYRLKGSARRGAGIAVGAASIVFIGLGTSGVGATARTATGSNNCTASDAMNKGDPGKVISNDQGTCDIAGNSTSNPASGYIAFDIAAGGTTDLVDLFQSVGNDQDAYVGGYALTLSDCVDHANAANAVSTVAGAYTLAGGPNPPSEDDSEVAATYPTEPSVSGTLATVSGTAGDEVTCAYVVSFSGSVPSDSFPSGRNDIWFNKGSGSEYAHTASNSVKLFGTSGSPTPDPSPSPTSGVLGTTTTTPDTGAGSGTMFGAGIGLLVLGLALVLGIPRRNNKPRA
jgi:LPXTG-motif cell wall-anchored protein